jgi:hypothetical protein
MDFNEECVRVLEAAEALHKKRKTDVLLIHNRGGDWLE